MEFVLWACKVVHILSAMVWLGGLVYANAVFAPVALHEKRLSEPWMRAVERRFQGYIWSTVWPLALTGAILLVMQPNLATAGWSDSWTMLMAAKVAAFVAALFFSWQLGVVVARLRDAASDPEEFDGWQRAYQRLLQRSIIAGLAAVLATGALGIVS